MGKLHLVDLAVSDHWSLTSYLVLTFCPHVCRELCCVSVWYLFYYDLYFYVFMWQWAIIFTLPSGCAVLCNMCNAQLLLQPQLILQWRHTLYVVLCVLLNYIFDLSAYLIGNQCVMHSLIHAKGFIYREMNIHTVGVILWSILEKQVPIHCISS
jgi:hypothetical protein